MATVTSFTRKYQDWQKDKIKLSNCRNKNGFESSKCSGELRKEQKSFAEAKAEAVELQAKGKLPYEFASVFFPSQSAKPSGGLVRPSSTTAETFTPTTEEQQAEILTMTSSETSSDSSSKIPFVIGGVVVAGLSILGIARWRRWI